MATPKGQKTFQTFLSQVDNLRKDNTSNLTSEEMNAMAPGTAQRQEATGQVKTATKDVVDTTGKDVDLTGKAVTAGKTQAGPLGVLQTGASAVPGAKIEPSATGAANTAAWTPPTAAPVQGFHAPTASGGAYNADNLGLGVDTTSLQNKVTNAGNAATTALDSDKAAALKNLSGFYSTAGTGASDYLTGLGKTLDAPTHKLGAVTANDPLGTRAEGVANALAKGAPTSNIDALSLLLGGTYDQKYAGLESQIYGGDVAAERGRAKDLIGERAVAESGRPRSLEDYLGAKSAGKQNISDAGLKASKLLSDEENAKRDETNTNFDNAAKDLAAQIEAGKAGVTATALQDYKDNAQRIIATLGVDPALMVKDPDAARVDFTKKLDTLKKILEQAKISPNGSVIIPQLNDAISVLSDKLKMIPVVTKPAQAPTQDPTQASTRTSRKKDAAPQEDTASDKELAVHWEGPGSPITFNKELYSGPVKKDKGDGDRSGGFSDGGPSRGYGRNNNVI